MIDSTGNRSPGCSPTRAEFFQIDLSDGSDVAKVLSSRSFEAVMHFAASIEAGESMMDPGKFYRNNLCNSYRS